MIWLGQPKKRKKKKKSRNASLSKCQTVYLSRRMSVAFLRILKIRRSPWSYSMFYLPLWGKRAPPLSNNLKPVGNLFCDKLISGATQLPPIHQINPPHFKIICHSSCRGKQFELLSNCQSHGGNLHLLNHPQYVSLDKVHLHITWLYQVLHCVRPESQ